MMMTMMILFAMIVKTEIAVDQLVVGYLPPKTCFEQVGPWANWTQHHHHYYFTLELHPLLSHPPFAASPVS